MPLTPDDLARIRERADAAAKFTSRPMDYDLARDIPLLLDEVERLRGVMEGLMEPTGLPAGQAVHDMRKRIRAAIGPMPAPSAGEGEA